MPTVATNSQAGNVWGTRMPSIAIAKGKSIAPHLKDLIKDFYECMGWERETGKPSQKTVEKLDLVEAAQGL